MTQATKTKSTAKVWRLALGTMIKELERELKSVMSNMKEDQLKAAAALRRGTDTEACFTALAAAEFGMGRADAYSEVIRELKALLHTLRKT